MLIGGNIKTVSLSSAKVIAVVCQSIDEFEAKPLTCKATLNEIELQSSFVSCVKGCGTSNAPIYGDT